MAQLIYEYTGDEVPAFLTLLTLRRADTGADVPLPDPATFAEDPAGTFTISFDEPAAGLTYLYTYRRTWDDGTYDPPEADSVQGASAASASGFWTTQAKAESRRGAINVGTRASLDGQSPAADVPTLQALVDDLDADADRAVAVRGYGRPADPAASVDYPVVSRIVTDVLWLRLEGRRPDLTRAQDRTLKDDEDALWDELDDMLMGETAYQGQTVDFPRTAATPATAPRAVYPTVDRDGRAVTAANAGRGAYWDAAAGAWRGYCG